MKNTKNTTLSIAFGAVAIALSVSLSFIKLFKMPQGGSVTLLRMLPIVLYSYMFGVRKGIFAGATYGVLDSMFDLWIVHPAQFILDYIVCFAAVGIAGIFRDREFRFKILTGTAIATVFRFLANFASGVIFFAEYAEPAGYSSAVLYSFVYNSTVFVDMAFVMVVVAVLELSRPFMRQMNRIKSLFDEEQKTVQKKEEDVVQ